MIEEHKNAPPSGDQLVRPPEGVEGGIPLKLSDF